MILVDNMEDLIGVLPTLDRDRYIEMMPYINENY